MKRWIKKLSRHSAVHGLIACIARGYIWLVMRTSRITHSIHPAAIPYLQQHSPALFVLWHSRILLIPAFNMQELNLCAMVSQHSDGRLIGRVLQGYSIKIVHGSTSRGGAHAMRQLITLYKQGNAIALTPDGPRGPREKVSEGTAQLALLTNAAIVPLSYHAKRAITLRSWDRFVIPTPFNRLSFTYGEPLQPEMVAHLPKEQQRSALRDAIERGLHEITRDI